MEIRPKAPAIGAPGSTHGVEKGTSTERQGKARFDELLEELARLRLENSGSGTSGDAQSLAKLDEALASADSLHRRAMDMRRSLESAFRRALGDA